MIIAYHIRGYFIFSIRTWYKGLLEREAKQRLQAFEQTCQNQGLRFKTEAVFTGEAVEEIVQASQKADLQVIGESMDVDTQAYEPRKRFVRDIVHRLHRPILIARAGHEHLKRIVVGYEGSDKGGHALQPAADLAERASSELTVVVAVERPEQGAILMDGVAVYLEGYRLSWKPAEFEGAPNEALSRTVERESADMVVVGSHGHGRLHGLAFGSTTNHVLEYIHTSILVYR